MECPQELTPPGVSAMFELLLTHDGRLDQHVGAMLDRLQDVDLWLVDSLEVPATLHDVEGRFVHMNAWAERACGKSNAQMVGRPLTELLPPETHEKVEAQFRLVVELGELTDFETVFVDAGGRLLGRTRPAAAAPIRRRDHRRSRSRVRRAPAGIRAHRLRPPSATHAPPAQDPRPDRLRPVHVRDRGGAHALPPRQFATICGASSGNCTCTLGSTRS